MGNLYFSDFFLSYLEKSYCIFYRHLSNIRANLLLWYPWKTCVEEGLLLRKNCGRPAGRHARQPRWKLRPFGHFGHLGLLAVAGWIIKVMRRHNCYLKMMCGQKKLLNTLFVYDGIKKSVILRYQRLAVSLLITNNQPILAVSIIILLFFRVEPLKKSGFPEPEIFLALNMNLILQYKGGFHLYLFPFKFPFIYISI